MNASNRQSKLKKLTAAQKGYIAGIFDGEGYLYITGEEYDESASSKIRVRMTDRCVLKHLRRITGIGTLTSYWPGQRRKDGGKKKQVFEWGIFKRVDVRDVLMKVRPFLVLKRKHAALLLDFDHLKDQGACHGIEVVRIRKALSISNTKGRVVNF